MERPFDRRYLAISDFWTGFPHHLVHHLVHPNIRGSWGVVTVAESRMMLIDGNSGTFILWFILWYTPTVVGVHPNSRGSWGVVVVAESRMKVLIDGNRGHQTCSPLVELQVRPVS